jgi:sigma-B regulation protein RsbU (phosphoserine phosphatase)
MQFIIKKILPILILGILIGFSTSSLTFFKANDAVFDFQSVNAAETPGNNKEISSKSGDLLYLETPEQQNFIKQKWQLLKGKLQWDIYEILVGTFLSIIGLAAITLALFRWIPNDLSLISFGMFCFLYGARTNAFQFFFDATPLFWGYWKSSITYIVPVTGYVFFEQIMGKGWKSSIRLMIYVSIVFAIAAISVGIALKAPYTAMLANSFFAIVVILVILVNLFWPGLQMTRELKVLRVGSLIFIVLALHANLMNLNIVRLPLSRDLEPLGFLIFIGCLAYIVVRRFFDNEKKLVTITYELETARQIQSFILPQKTVDIKGIHLAAHYVPMASVAGDFYDFARVDEKRLGILVADVSGHGVPASLISAMVKIAFVSQLSDASNPARVLAGINQILCGKLESDFVTAGYLFIDTIKQNVFYAGAGHPPLLLWRGSEQKIYEFREKGIILGQFEDAQYQNIDLELKSGDRFFLYTDGIIETTNAAGIRYGKDQFKEFITSHASLPVGHFTDVFIQHISSWSGKHSEDTLDDDLTLIVADFENT